MRRKGTLGNPFFSVVPRVVVLPCIPYRHLRQPFHARYALAILTLVEDHVVAHHHVEGAGGPACSIGWVLDMIMMSAAALAFVHLSHEPQVALQVPLPLASEEIPPCGRPATQQLNG